ncbi:endo-beta-N-acetylglucosaminidase [Clostridium omnivorum]|uniref:Endo-beta-N-acetylglucosaminidase n=1 Tax=Clostridium omnivorum TaxID=1604902 RepID=A0ABQ5N6R2_9CLOT|nr:discoidin domain-containing protein [Clostridium sp. E14]GLC30877.1 endo-beta-N-acetylglucosaminidase [Clostridium sp. E14]
MKLKKRLSALALGIMVLFNSINLNVSAITKDDQAMQEKTGQPLASYWFPEELLKWSPSTDKDAKFNRGTVPLQKRVKGNKLNSTQSDKAKVVSLAIANEHTSSTPSQGSNKFENYNFTYWQYVDTLVAWAGSSGEGIIVPPSSDLIDSAHRNGVEILGTVFFPPEAYGGKIQWVKAFLSKDSNGNFIMADKLLEAAKYYGFDGWFINQETNGLTEEEAATFKEFLVYIQNKKDKDMQIMWYDSMIKNGNVKWQRQLNDNNKQFLQDGNTRVSDGMFLDFYWYYTIQWNSDGTYTALEPKKLENSKAVAEQLGRSPYDLYAGIDVQANGYDTLYSMDADFNELYPNKGTGALSTLFPEGQEPTTSLGLYCPSWTYYSSANYDEFLKKENRFWVSESGDPRNTNTPHPWKGISNYFVEKSPVTSIPFVTNFNMGNGKFYNVNGNKAGNLEWNNRSLQEVMPTYRWVIDNNGGNLLKASEDYTDSYYGGSSIKLQGALNKGGNSLIKLYNSDLKIQEDTIISLTYKQNANTNLKLALSFDGSNETKYFDLKSSGNVWKNSEVSLADFSGRKLDNISLYVSGNESKDDYKLNLGRLEIRNNLDKLIIGKPSNLKIDDSKIRDSYFTTARLSWDKVPGEVQQYEIYRIKADGSREFLGATPNNAYFVQEIQRDGREKDYKFAVKAVNKYFEASESNETIISGQWPDYPAPKASFEISSSIAAPGEEIVFKSTSSAATEQLEWTIEGAVPDKSTDKEVKVKFDKEGIYTVSLKAKNAAGEDVMRKDNLITISKDAVGGIKNLALNKAAEASGFTNDSEGPSKAVDGSVKNKWCTTNSGDKWLIVDLGKTSTITDFAIKHAAAGGEGGALNTSDFKIQLSDDKTNWNTVVDVKDNVDGITRHPIDYTAARYARLYITQAEKGSGSGGAARIYEFEINGVEAAQLTVPKYSALKSALRDKIYEGKDTLNQYNKLTKAVLAFKEELSNAEQVLNNDSAEAQAIMDETDRLNTAIQEFIKSRDKADFSKLQAAVDYMQKQSKNFIIGNNAGQYKQEDMEAFSKVFNEANALLLNFDATQEEVNSMVGKLSRSFELLKAKVIKEDNKEQEPSNNGTISGNGSNSVNQDNSGTASGNKNTTLVKTGSTVDDSLLVLLGFSLIFGGIIIGIRKKKSS